MAVDFGRRPYTTKCRPFRDSDEEVDLVWYPCAPGAKVLPFPSVMHQTDWDVELQPWLPVGEVPDAPKVFNGKPIIPGTGLGHFCGEESDFDLGGKRDEAIPPVVRGATGLPDCCRPPVLGAGGVADGGRAVVTWALEPGLFCSEALEVEWDTTYLLDCQAFATHWLKLPAEAPTSFVYCRSNVRIVNPAATIPDKRDGFACESLISNGVVQFTDETWEYSPTGGDDGYVMINAGTQATFTIRFSLTPL